MFDNVSTPQEFADIMTGQKGPNHLIPIDYMHVLEAQADNNELEVVLQYHDNLPTRIRPFGRATLKKALFRFASASRKHQHCFVYRVSKDAVQHVQALAREFPALQWFIASNKMADFVIVRGSPNTKIGSAALMNFKAGYHGLDKVPE